MQNVLWRPGRKYGWKDWRKAGPRAGGDLMTSQGPLDSFQSLEFQGRHYKTVIPPSFCQLIIQKLRPSCSGPVSVIECRKKWLLSLTHLQSEKSDIDTGKNRRQLGSGMWDPEASEMGVVGYPLQVGTGRRRGCWMSPSPDVGSSTSSPIRHASGTAIRLPFTVVALQALSPPLLRENRCGQCWCK